MKKKIIISVIAGLLCVASSFFPITIDKTYDVYFYAGMVLPLCIGAFSSFRCALISGLIVFLSYFILPGSHGFADLSPALAILIFTLGNTFCWKKCKKLSFFINYIFSAVFTVVFLTVGRLSCYSLAKLNRHFPFGYAFSHLPYNIINASFVYLTEVLILCFLILNILRRLPAVKKILNREIYAYEQYNDQLALVILAVAAIIIMISASSNSGIAYFSVTINSYQNTIGFVQLLLIKEIILLIVGDCVIFLLNYRYKQEAEKLETERTQKAIYNFLHQTAHEIKAPLRAIHLYNETLSENKALSEDSRCVNAFEKINFYCNKSLNLLSKLLEYSKKKSQALNFTVINMALLVKDVIDELCGIYSDRQISCHIDKLPEITGDENLIKCCVMNILSNSFKYSEKKDKTVITIKYFETDKEYIFSFRDNGAGFDMAYADHLFDMFQRMHSDSEFEGTGIGLALVKDIIKKHGGWVKAYAEPDNGCTITFSVKK